MSSDYPDAPHRLRSVFLAGAFPPPVHGFANAMLSVHDLLHARGHRTVKLVTSSGAAKSAAIAVFFMFWGLLRNIAILIWNAPRNGVFYLGISGGIRQVLDAVLSLVARLVRMPFVVHHHSFAYLNKPTALTRLCFALAGDDCIHVALCECMAQALRDKYQVRGKVFVISNAALMEFPASARHRERSPGKITVGFLGAITAAKGVDNMISIAEQLGPIGGFQFVVAGSRPEPELLSRMQLLATGTDYFSYVGPVYGDQKDAFLSSLDVLLFPTKYVNEAEPLVVLEALAHGVPVIANQRGCLREFAGSAHVTIVPEPSLFEAIAVHKLKGWRDELPSLKGCSEEAQRDFAQLRGKSCRALDELFALIESL